MGPKNKCILIYDATRKKLYYSKIKIKQSYASSLYDRKEKYSGRVRCTDSQKEKW